jgi:hypothetical protein
MVGGRCRSILPAEIVGPLCSGWPWFASLPLILFSLEWSFSLERSLIFFWRSRHPSFENAYCVCPESPASDKILSKTLLVRPSKQPCCSA